MERTPTMLPLAVAGGLAVASVYYAPPLLDVMAAGFGMAYATVGAVVTAGQIGYGIGLALVVPLGDLLDRSGCSGWRALRVRSARSGPDAGGPDV